MTASPFRAVAPVSAVCAAFAAQPSVYPLEALKPNVAPTCGSLAGKANAEGNRLRAVSGGEQSRKRRRQDKAAVSGAPRGGHICPRCGQFGVFAEELLQARK